MVWFNPGIIILSKSVGGSSLGEHDDNCDDDDDDDDDDGDDGDGD